MSIPASSAAVEANALYPKGNGANAFQRAVSRLIEMQGEAYIGLGHLVSRETDLVEDPVTCTR